MALWFPASRRISLATSLTLLALGIGGCMPGDVSRPADERDVGPFLIGAGDIAGCDALAEAEATAAILDTLEGTVITLGDNAYPTGQEADFENCYRPTWGRHRDRTRPSPGNHDWLDPFYYFTYFGERAGPVPLGYYSYDVGTWHVVSLNSNRSGAKMDLQLAWLRADLQQSQALCTLAYWHHPLFSSGPHGDAPRMQVFWDLLYEFGADIVVSAHDHTYERFAPMDPLGTRDTVRGIRQFVAGTGGQPLYHVGTFGIRANSEAFQSRDHGVIRFSLAPGAYRWEFVPVTVNGFRDRGQGTCH
jgi:hypothetical protein